MPKPATAEKLESRELAPLVLRASFNPATFNEDERTVEVTWTTGARVLRIDWDGRRYYEELSLDKKHVRLGRLNNGAPFLAAHNGYDLRAVLGVVERAELTPEGGTAVVRFSQREEVQPIVRDIRDGIIQNVSVGYRVYRLEKIEDGEEEIPVYRATDWEPFEISAVPMGADDGAGFRSQDTKPNACVIVTRQPEQESTMPDPTNPNPEGNRATPAPSPAPGADPDKVRAEAAKAERERVAAILTACRAAQMDEDFTEAALRSEKTVDQVRAEIIDKIAEKAKQTITRSHLDLSAGDDARDKWQRGASDWIIQRAGLAQTVVEAGKKRGEQIKVEPGEFRGLSLVELARDSLERAGVKTRGMDKQKMVGLAFTYRGDGAGYQSTSDFAVVLENTMHKVLLAAFAIQPDTWTRWCAVGSVSDFRPHNRYRMGTFGKLDALNENGEFKNKTIPDALKELIQAATRGNIIGLSRQAIINDDLGAFANLATMFGRAAALSIEIDAYAALASNGGLGPTLADGKTLFHADHGNINATGSALSVAGIDADRVVLAQQKDHSGNEFLDLRPAVLVLPIGLGGDARVINDAQYDPDTANKLQKPNKVRGLFRDIVDTPRLSGTRRYLFADPGIAPVMEVAFLDGQREPFLETMNGWRVDGVEWKVRIDYAVGGVGYQGAVTNAGQ